MVILSATENLHELLGYAVDDFLSGKISLQSCIHKHDQDIAKELFSTDINRPAGSFNIRLRHANGRIRCIRGQYTKTLANPDSSVILELLLQDAKNLWQQQGKQAQMANFNAMMENTDDYIFFKDRNHVFTAASQTLVAITAPSEHWTDLVGKTDYDVFPEDYADTYYNLEKQVFAGINIAQEVQEYIGNDGNKGWVDNRKYPLRDEQGGIIGLFGVARDITKNKLTEETLARSEAKFRTLFDSTGDAILMLDTKRFFDCNQAALDLFGLQSHEELRTYHPADLSPATQACGTDSMTLAKKLIDTALKKGAARFEWIHKRADTGKEFICDIMLNSLMLDDRLVLQTTIRDISKQKEIEADLRIAAIAFESQEAMEVTDPTGTILRVNKAFRKITGYTSEEVIGKNPRTFKSNYHNAGFYTAMWQRLIKTGAYTGEVWNQRKNGEIYPAQLNITAVKNASGSVINYVGTFTDISTRKATEARVGFLANHDHLTQLPNRELFYDRLSQAFSQSRRKDENFALLFLDLDGFKPINDTYGHEAGDTILKVVAKRLQTCVRNMDTVARMGGDEFAIIITALKDPLSAEMMAKKIIHTIAEDIKVTSSISCSIGVSIGIAIYPDHGSELDKLMHAADTAMYTSKASGKNTYTLSTRQHNQADINEAWIRPEDTPLLGIDIIDEQHLKIASLLNKLNDALKYKSNPEDARQILDEMVVFTCYHFETEERLMDKYAYPESAAHKKAHDNLLQETAYLKGKFSQGGELLLLQKIKDWFATHITPVDKDLADFLIQKKGK